jgi:two-component system CitB family sensor kinase
MATRPLAGRPRRRRPSIPRGIAARLLAIQLSVLLVVAVVATVALWADSRQRAEQAAADRSLAVATTVADSPRVAEGLTSADPTAALLDYALDVTRTVSRSMIVTKSTPVSRVTSSA